MAMSWDDFEQSAAFRRPPDWRDRPNGPDRIDFLAADLSRASCRAVTRADLLGMTGVGVAPVILGTATEHSIQDPFTGEITVTVRLD